MPIQILPFLFLFLLLVNSSSDAADSPTSIFHLELLPAVHTDASPLLYQFFGRAPSRPADVQVEEDIIYLGLELPPDASYYEFVGAQQLKQRLIQGVISTETPIRSSEWPALQMRCARIHTEVDVSSTSNMRKLLATNILQEQKRKMLMFLCSPFNFEADIPRTIVTIYTSASSSSTESPFGAENRGIPSFLVCHPAFFLQLALAFLLLAFLAGILYISMD